MNATLLLIRHGQIRANVSGRWHGATDSPLTRVGRRQALRVATHLKRSGASIDAVYSSPLARCRATAAQIGRAFSRAVEVHDDLREYGVGAFEDLPVAELHERHDFFQLAHRDADYAPPGGDSVNAVAARIVPVLQRLGHAGNTGTIAVVSHGAALGIALASLLDDDPRAWRNYHVANCSITELRFVDAGTGAARAEVGAFNQTHHL
jgi:broad specificity phosphatase PhoE